MTRSESTRDQDESAFTPLLREIFRASSQVLAVGFVDFLGECVDYCASLEPFDAKVSAAHMSAIIADMTGRWQTLPAGAPWLIVVNASTRDLVVRRISEEYSLVIVVEAGGWTQHLVEKVHSVVRLLRREACVQEPPWDDDSAYLQVETRSSSQWHNAPRVIASPAGRIRLKAVLGRWDGASEGGRRIEYFRVHTAQGEEWTLAHDLETDAWRRSA